MLLAVPRAGTGPLNLFSYHLYVAGAIFALASIAMGGVDTGWTFYTPYSTTTNSHVIAMTMGAFILGFSSIFTAEHRHDS